MEHTLVFPRPTAAPKETHAEMQGRMTITRETNAPPETANRKQKCCWCLKLLPIGFVRWRIVFQEGKQNKTKLAECLINYKADLDLNFRMLWHF